MPSLAPCDLEPIPDISELKDLVEQYDELLERCMRYRLTDRDQNALNDLYSILLSIENQHWIGVSHRIIELIVDRSDLDFPMIRYKLGILPH